MSTRPQRKRHKPKPKSDTYETSSTVIGVAYTMPDQTLLAAVEGPPIDFQARQDSISEKRRSPGAGLAPKVKRTSAKPSAAKETKVKL